MPLAVPSRYTTAVLWLVQTCISLPVTGTGTAASTDLSRPPLDLHGEENSLSSRPALMFHT